MDWIRQANLPSLGVKFKICLLDTLPVFRHLMRSPINKKKEAVKWKTSFFTRLETKMS